MKMENLKTRKFDIIIIGAGLSGLSLMLEFNKKTDANILILEKNKELRKDKNFCFWNYPNNGFSEKFSHEWKKIKIKFNHEEIIKTHSDLSYRRISSDILYKESLKTIEKSKNIKILYNQDVKKLYDLKKIIKIETNNNYYHSSFVFDSRPFKLQKKKLVQHFYGIEVIANDNVFDEDIVTLMDFKKKKNTTHFFYILPFSKKKALIETTYFSKKILTFNEYRNEINLYLKSNFPNKEFKYNFEETGVIPMYRQKKFSISNKIIKIGTPGNWVKPSTGYSFQNAFLFSEILVGKYIKSQPLVIKHKVLSNFLDGVFCVFLSKYPNDSNITFFNFFKKLKLQTTINYLTDSYSFSDIIKIIFSLPKLKLIKSMFIYLIKSND